jgi:hypothetical protein
MMIEDWHCSPRGGRGFSYPLVRAVAKMEDEATISLVPPSITSFALQTALET